MGKKTKKKKEKNGGKKEEDKKNKKKQKKKLIFYCGLHCAVHSKRLSPFSYCYNIYLYIYNFFTVCARSYEVLAGDKRP
jgi:hypothetical protein